MACDASSAGIEGPPISTVVISVAVLLASLGSTVVVVSVAWLVISPAVSGALTLIVRVVATPTARLASWQLRVFSD